MEYGRIFHSNKRGSIDSGGKGLKSSTFPNVLLVIFCLVHFLSCNLLDENKIFDHDWQITESDLMRSTRLYIGDSLKVIYLNKGKVQNEKSYIVFLNRQNKALGYISGGYSIISLSDTSITIESDIINEDDIQYIPKGITVNRIDLCGCANTYNNLLITDFKFIKKDSIKLVFQYNKNDIFANDKIIQNNIVKSHPDIDSLTIPIAFDLFYDYNNKNISILKFNGKCWHFREGEFINKNIADSFYLTLFRHFLDNDSSINSLNIKS